MNSEKIEKGLFAIFVSTCIYNYFPYNSAGYCNSLFITMSIQTSRDVMFSFFFLFLDRLQRRKVFEYTTSKFSVCIACECVCVENIKFVKRTISVRPKTWFLMASIQYMIGNMASLRAMEYFWRKSNALYVLVYLSCPSSRHRSTEFGGDIASRLHRDARPKHEPFVRTI